MLYNLPAPAMRMYQHSDLLSGCNRIAHYRLGKKRPGSGNLVLISRSALMLQAIATMPTMTAPITAVFDFQLAGCAYHPPEGDQTCLGYLMKSEYRRKRAVVEAECVRDFAMTRVGYRGSLGLDCFDRMVWLGHRVVLLSSCQCCWISFAEDEQKLHQLYP